ncbi:MAG: Subtilisin DY [Acidobacteria bacterium ADurb.Bin340]|nr:MAG: Subtilisin DY [Acidobacteria bacterium ADurb.Bin340]
MVVVAAAGNEGTDVVDAIPAAIPEVISVGAVNTPVIWDQGITWFSNRGIRLDILAPGSDILSLCAEGTNSAPLESHYARMEGTSMAAPHVAGVAALLLSRNPGLSVEAVRQLLRSTAKPDRSDPLVVAGGLGLVDADAALAETRVLEAHLSRPYPGEKITAPIEIQGTIQGQGVTGWELAWGAGRTPSAWHSLQSGTSAVVAGTLATLDPRALPEGVVTLRLSAKDDRGKIYRFDSVVEADFLALQEPALPEFLVYALQFKPGQPIPIKGRVDFSRPAPGTPPWVLPGAGWKTVGGDSGPRNGDLGTWTPDASLVAGHYTLRIRVEDGGVTRTDPTVVHLEPALISPQWPKFLDRNPMGGVILHKDGSGNPELGAITNIRHPAYVPGVYHRFRPDGTPLPAPGMQWGSDETSVVADLDPAIPGDEVALIDYQSILIMNGSTKVREIPLGNSQALGQSPILTTIKGAPALVAMTFLVGQDYRRLLTVVRPDGTSVSPAFPLECDASGGNGFFDNVEVLVGDLNGDGKQEFIVPKKATDSSWKLHAYSEEGQLLSWSTPEQPGIVRSMILADVDRDGFMEVLASHGAGMAVFRHDGSYYPGWPRTDIQGNLICADLDRDGIEEIIAVEQTKLHVVKADGTPWSSDWPQVRGNSEGFGFFESKPAVADVTGDGRQEILVMETNWNDGWILNKWPDFINNWSRTARMVALDTMGRTVKAWNLPGTGSLAAFDMGFKATLGDFNKDGRLDVGACFYTAKTGSGVTVMEGGGLTVLTTSAPWAAGTHDWPCSTGDAWNRRTLLRDPKVALPGITGGMMVAGAWPVEIQAWNVPGRKEVWLEVDGQRVGSALLQAPFRLEWDTKASGLGNHAVQAFARTGSGGVVASPKVTVQVVDKIATAFGDLTLTQGRNPALAGEALTVEATLQPATATGEVSFTVGSASPVRVALVQGKASLALAKLAAGTHAVTAQYEGASFYSASASAPLSLKVWDYQLAASAAEVQVAPNQAGTVTVTLTPEGGFAGDVQLTCTGLPADVEARFTPLASGADGKQTSTLSLSLKPKPVPPSPGWLLGGGLLGLGFLAPRRRRRTVGAWVFGGLVLVGLVACGGGGGGSASKDKSYNAVVTGTWEGSTRSCTVKVVVKQ